MTITSVTPIHLIKVKNTLARPWHPGHSVVSPVKAEGAGWWDFHTRVLSGLPSEQPERSVFCDIGCLLLAHCFDGGGGTVTLQGQQTTHFSTLLVISLMKNVTRYHSPTPFFCILEPPKSLLSLMRQVADFTASERVCGGVTPLFPLCPVFLEGALRPTSAEGSTDCLQLRGGDLWLLPDGPRTPLGAGLQQVTFFTEVPAGFSFCP